MRGWGAGRVPACQRRSRSSSRPKMRARAAMIKVWMAVGIQAHFSCACMVPCRRAIWSPKEGALFSMRRILTNCYVMRKEKMWRFGKFFVGEGWVRRNLHFVNKKKQKNFIR